MLKIKCNPLLVRFMINSMNDWAGENAIWQQFVGARQVDFCVKCHIAWNKVINRKRNRDRYVIANFKMAQKLFLLEREIKALQIDLGIPNN